MIRLLIVMVLFVSACTDDTAQRMKVKNAEEKARLDRLERAGHGQN